MYIFLLKMIFNTYCCVWVMLFCFTLNLPAQSDRVGNLPVEDGELMRRARELAKKYIIVDGHVDLPYRLKVKNFRLQREYLGIPVESKEGDFDYLRAKKGELDAPFMSIYIPSELQKTGGAKALADSLIEMVEGIIRSHPDKFAAARSPSEITENFKKGLISLPMGMENGAPIGNQLHNLSYYYKKGIRYITLTHATDNLICDSSYDTTRTWKGLSAFGREVVREMNRLGLIIDISHVSDSAFFQVMRLTQAPVIASHSSCRKFTPGFLRNMSDDMIRLMGKNSGVIMINFASTFLDEDIRLLYEKQNEKALVLQKEKNISFEEALKQTLDQLKAQNQTVYTDVERVADHIDHIVKLAGINCVGLGSDFDGVGDTLPVGLKDVSDYPNLIFALLKRGYSEEDIAKICYKNIFRVWNEVEKTARKK